VHAGDLILADADPFDLTGAQGRLEIAVGDLCFFGEQRPDNDC